MSSQTSPFSFDRAHIEPSTPRQRPIFCQTSSSSPEPITLSSSSSPPKPITLSSPNPHEKLSARQNPRHPNKPGELEDDGGSNTIGECRVTAPLQLVVATASLRKSANDAWLVLSHPTPASGGDPSSTMKQGKMERGIEDREGRGTH